MNLSPENYFHLRASYAFSLVSRSGFLQDRYHCRDSNSEPCIDGLHIRFHEPSWRCWQNIIAKRFGDQRISVFGSVHDNCFLNVCFTRNMNLISEETRTSVGKVGINCVEGVIFDRFRRVSSCHLIYSPRRFWSVGANCLGICTKKFITVDVGQEKIHIGALLTLKCMRLL